MTFKHQDNTQIALKELWGRNVPELTSEQIELSVKVWEKIKARKQQERKIGEGVRSKE